MNPWVALLLLLGFVIVYFWWIAAIVAPVVVAWIGYRMWQRHQAATDAAAAARVDIAARADQQHAQLLDGDDRGVYGDYPPAI
ncbi:hypothetical protein [Mycobacterium sp. ITM-2016-00318]|uniref:hypothetical protein n=1 Tax=Mycobacterium sp. ITM-2016-00318 TaxID=2099693 RepID=UPI000CF97A4F|nr:hypothetical protein [Mycobacterium sp. ITM-2016-00318]WNG93685.1 hypothetical protein C6A82_004235 [Mycobacterium sp. ITM-2016-00318]